MRTLALTLLFACGGSSSAPETTTTAPAPAAHPAFDVKVSGAGRPVIFIPGLGSPGAVWDGTVAHLNGKVQAHVLTLAGFAGQPAIQPPFLLSVHDQLVDYIKHLDHPIVVGHSLGGAMSLWLAETNSVDLGGIVDVDGLPFIAAILDPTMTEAKAAETAKQIAAGMGGGTHEQFVEQTQKFVSTMVTSEKDQKFLADAAARSDQHAFANAFAELYAKDLRADLPKITTKVTLVIATEQRGDVPRPQLEAAWHAQIDALKGADVHFVDHAKHFVMLDQPDAFYALLDQVVAAH